jgi:hypothetical protein
MDTALLGAGTGRSNACRARTRRISGLEYQNQRPLSKLHINVAINLARSVLLTVEGLRPRLPSTRICYLGLADARVVDFRSGLSSAVLGGLCTNETETPCDWVSEIPIDKKLEYLRRSLRNSD